MRFFEYKLEHTLEHSPSEDGRAGEFRDRLIAYVQKQKPYKSLHSDASSISFDNGNFFKRVFPFFGLRSFDIKLLAKRSSLDIKATVFVAGVATGLILSAIVCIFSLLGGSYVFLSLAVLTWRNYYLAKKELKMLIEIGLGESKGNDP